MVRTRPDVGTFVRLVDAGIVAVDGSGRDAEAVLHGERDAAGRVILQLGHADEDVGVVVGVVQIVGREHVGAPGTLKRA